MHDYGFDRAKPFTTTLSGTQLSYIDGDLLTNPTEFCKLVGTLHYLMRTFPDTCYAVNVMC